jgi:hypothetical protein
MDAMKQLAWKIEMGMKQISEEKEIRTEGALGLFQSSSLQPFPGRSSINTPTSTFAAESTFLSC